MPRATSTDVYVKQQSLMFMLSVSQCFGNVLYKVKKVLNIFGIIAHYLFIRKSSCDYNDRHKLRS